MSAELKYMMLQNFIFLLYYTLNSLFKFMARHFSFSVLSGSILSVMICCSKDYVFFSTRFRQPLQKSSAQIKEHSSPAPSAGIMLLWLFHKTYFGKLLIANKSPVCNGLKSFVLYKSSGCREFLQLPNKVVFSKMFLVVKL